MALVPDSTTKYNSGATTGSTHTYAFNNVAGNGVAVCLQFPNNLTVNSVTYNGDAMTQGAAVSISTYWKSQIWTSTGFTPATGSNNVVVTFNSATDAYLTSQAISFTGANTSSLVGATNTNTNTGASPTSVSITTLNDGSYIVDSMLLNHNAGGITKDASQTLIGTDYNTTWTYNGGSSYFSKTTAGAKTMQWTYTTADDACICALEIKAAAGASVNSNFFAFM